MAEEQQNLFSATIRGEITRIIYENDDQTYTVLRLLTEDGEKTVVGTIPQVAPGQHLEVTGRWEKHADFGSQFRAFNFRPILPSTSTGIVRFLSSGAIPGVGEKTAGAIVDYFGADTLDVLEKFPKRLREVPKMSEKKATAIAAAWRESASRRDTFIYLQGLGITPAYCNKLYQQYGNLASEVVRANPYRLAEEVDGIGFLKADEIASGLGIAKDSPERLTAAAVYQMNQLTGNGHVGYPEEQFEICVAEMTGLEPEKARIGINRALERRMLVRQSGMLYAPALARAERELPELIGRLAAVKNFAGKRLLDDGRKSKIELSDEQRSGCDRMTLAPLAIITGGPGVGKTTVIGEIVRRAKAAGLRIAAAAPTGRAAKRLSETTGLTAKTLHRLLMFDPKTGRFGFDETNPLQCDLLIVDEVSMLDILLALALFRAIEPETSVLLVGDRDQLPSVGPGTVFADLIASGLFLTTHLTRVFRQA
ncbi:MAG: AAA family ATPase, partial [Victivallaceae bacterium]